VGVCHWKSRSCRRKLDSLKNKVDQWNANKRRNFLSWVDDPNRETCQSPRSTCRNTQEKRRNCQNHSSGCRPKQWNRLYLSMNASEQQEWRDGYNRRLDQMVAFNQDENKIIV
jgi:hypothetical protein